MYVDNVGDWGWFFVFPELRVRAQFLKSEDGRLASLLAAQCCKHQ